MEENERQEYSLEDIMKEFSAESEETESAEATVEASVAEAAETVTDDTVKMEPVVAENKEIDESVANADTIRLDISQLPEGKVNEEAESIDDSREQPAEEKEAFTEQWEPEYEQPMGEYIPAPQIIVHPQSRLRELKRKLVAGPEKRYYELSEVGLGKLQFAIVAALLVTLLSAAISVLHRLDWVSPERTRLLVFGQLFMLLLVALPGSFQLAEGLTDLFKGRFTPNTFLVFGFIACCVDAAFCLDSLRIPCCAAFSLQMLMSLWGAYHKRHTEMGAMDTMRKAVRLNKLALAEDVYEGRAGLLRGQGQVEDFMDHYNTVSGPEKVLNWYSLAALVASIGIGVAAGILYDIPTAVQVLSVSLMAAMPATTFITLTRPMCVLEKQLHKLGAVLCGWRGVKGLRGKRVFPLSHEDLFPVGAAKMNGVKFFGNREPDEIVAYCTALVVADGGGLAPLFTQVLESRNGRHYDVVNLQAYDGGIGGEVCGEPVLVGLLPFLRDMGVDIPEGIRVNQAVCVSIDGELCGLFAVTYEKNKYAAVGLTALCADRRIRSVLTNGDFMLTPSFLRAKFGINPKRLVVPEHEQCQLLRQQTLEEDAPALLLVTQEGLAPLTIGTVGARALYTASILGVIFHMAGGILGLAVMVTLLVLNGIDLLTPLNMFLWQLVWIIPGWLVTQWTKTI